MTDVVVDTNVWMHACGPSGSRIDRYKASLRFIAGLQDSATRLGLDAKEVKAGEPVDSKILGEYKVKFLEVEKPSIAATVLAVILSEGRFRPVKLKHVSASKKHWARDNVHDSSDRPFLLVALDSKSKVLVSHDETHFPPQLRGEIESQLGVEVCDAERGCDLLT